MLIDSCGVLNSKGNVPNTITMLDEMVVELKVGVVGVGRAEDEGGSLVISNNMLGDFSVPVL